jgi:hypothetical protein
MTSKQELIAKAKDLFSKIDMIPKSFDPMGTPMGVDRDWAFDVIDETQMDENDCSIESSIDDLDSIVDILDSYLKLHLEEISNLVFLQYDTPSSVHEIMDAIGTRGVSNSEDGLNIFREKHYKLNKTDYLVIQGDSFYVIDKEEFGEYKNDS